MTGRGSLTMIVAALWGLPAYAQEPSVKIVEGVPIYNYDEAPTSQALHTSRLWILNFPEGISDGYIAAFCQDTPGNSQCTAQGHPSGQGLAYAEFHGTEMELRELLRRHPDSKPEFIEPDAEVSLFPGPDDVDDMGVGGVASWGLDRIDDHDVNCLDGSYRAPTGSKEGDGAHVYVADTGIRTTHQDFAGRAIAAIDCTSGSCQECNGDKTCAYDGHGHGTHCAGTIGGTTYGVAKKVALYAVKVLSDSGSGSMSGILKSIDWVASKGVKPAVWSASLGGRGQRPSYEVAFKKAISSGVLISVAAGNSKSSACNFSPAFAPSAITAGATDETDSRAGFSNYGSCVDIFAPGVRIVSASGHSDTGSKTMSGTSMACPHVSGALALFLADNPGMDLGSVRDLMMRSAGKNFVKDAKAGSPNLMLYTGRKSDDMPKCTTTTATTTTTTPKPLTPASGFCGFESSIQPFCDIWHQSAQDDFDWSRRSGSTPSAGTGPGSARSGSYYIYTEMSHPRQSNDVAILEALTPLLKSGAFLSFFYHMKGSSDMGSLRVQARSTKTDHVQSLWSISGNQGDQWRFVMLDLSSFSGESLRISFSGNKAATWKGDIAIDDVMLSTEAQADTTTPPPGASTYFAMPKGSCCCPARELIFTKAECEKAHDALGLKRNVPWIGAASIIPGGCSTRQGHSHNLHWNSEQPGSSRSDMTPVCKRASTAVTTTSSSVTSTTAMASTSSAARSTPIPTTATSSAAITTNTSTTTTAASTSITTTTTVTTTNTSVATTTTTVVTTTRSTTSTHPPVDASIQSGDVVFLRTLSGGGAMIDIEDSTVRSRWVSHGNWQAIRVEKENGGAISSGDAVFLKTQKGAYIDVSGEQVQARWADRGDWQRLIIKKRNGDGPILQNDLVCFTAHTGKLVDVEPEGTVVRARWSDCGDWQSMSIEMEAVGAVFSGDAIHLLTHTGKRVDVEGTAVQARWAETGTWQTFHIQNYGGRAIFSGDAVFVQSHTGKVLDVHGTDVQARWTDWGLWQQFHVHKKYGSGAVFPGDPVFLQTHTGTLIDVQDTAVKARYFEKGDWQTLVVEAKTDRQLSGMVEPQGLGEISVKTMMVVVVFMLAGLIMMVQRFRSASYKVVCVEDFADSHFSA